jgi:hypothetical protein
MALVLENILKIARVIVTHQNNLLLDVLVFLLIDGCHDAERLLVCARVHRWVLLNTCNTLCLSSFIAIKLLL